MNALLLPLTVPYGLVVSARNRLYEAGWLAQRALPRPVISIGNLTAGGTGKTPFVIWLAERLAARGTAVGILSRGYRRRGPAGPLLVSDGRGRHAGADEAGDEPVLIAERCPGAVVAVGPDRAALGAWVLAQRPLDVLILDDGFQHRALARDLDLVLIDVSDRAGLRALLPAGRLREPWRAVTRAHAVVLTRAEPDSDVDAVMSVCRRLPAEVPRPVITRFVPEAWVGPAGAPEPPEALRMEPVVAFSGIGNADSFDRMLAQCGVRIIEHVRFPDHHRYQAGDLDRIRARGARAGAAMATTEKDMVKVRRWIGAGERIRALRLGIEFLDGEGRLSALLDAALTRGSG